MPQLELGSCPQLHQVVLYDAQGRRWLSFEKPVAVLTAHRLEEVIPVLEAVQQWVNDRHYYAAGFLSYEAAPAFDHNLRVKACTQLPLAWFGIYPPPQEVVLPGAEDTPVNQSLEWTPSISAEQFYRDIHQIKQHIAAGETYQVNYSFRLRSPFFQSPWTYFLQLVQAQEGLYGAYLELEDWVICCASPELFFQQSGNRLTCRPMKGTTRRGQTFAGDRQLAQALHQSEKNRAENLMIVDMIRNDLGRIAEIGSVQVPQLFDLEQYPTLWQMTSVVQATTQANFVAVMRSLFPCASITGAPKCSTMKIISELEDAPRRIYTGTIGYLAPDQTAQFNVAIRTVLIDKTAQQAEYGVGAGIVWDSVAEDEYQECCTKAEILTRRQPAFSLLESLQWTPNDSYFLLDLHCQRLQHSAEYFAFQVDLEAVREKLGAIAQTLSPFPHKVRLLVSKGGEIKVSAAVIEEHHFSGDQSVNRPYLNVSLASHPVNSSNIFLYHKTTHRTVYDQARQQFPYADDVLLWNERGELTEFCNANLVVEWQGEWYTPPVECGLLAGTFRIWLLSQGKLKEKVIHREDLHQCSRIFWINSVRGIRACVLVQAETVEPS